MPPHKCYGEAWLAFSYNLRYYLGCVPGGQVVLPKQFDYSAKVVPNVDVIDADNESQLASNVATGAGFKGPLCEYLCTSYPSPGLPPSGTSRQCGLPR